MQFLVQPLFSVSPTLSPKAQKGVLYVINAVAYGAFEQHPDYRFSVTHSSSVDSTTYHIEFSAKFGPRDAREPELRIAETTLQLIKILASELGIPVRQSGLPSINMLRLPGLTRYRIRCKLAEFFASFASPGSIELTSHLSDFRIRITTGRPLGSIGPHPVYLCKSLIYRRRTKFGEVVRIRAEGKQVSIVVPSDLDPSAVSDGAAIHTMPVVGLVPRRLLQVERCQIPLFHIDQDARDQIQRECFG